MASYVDSNLSKGEEVIVRAHVSWLSFLITIIVSLFFLLIAFGGFTRIAWAGSFFFWVCLCCLMLLLRSPLRNSH